MAQGEDPRPRLRAHQRHQRGSTARRERESGTLPGSRRRTDLRLAAGTFRIDESRMLLGVWETQPPIDLLAGPELPTSLDVTRADYAIGEIGVSSANLNMFTAQFQISMVPEPDRLPCSFWGESAGFGSVAVTDPPWPAPAPGTPAPNGRLRASPVQSFLVLDPVRSPVRGSGSSQDPRRRVPWPHSARQGRLPSASPRRSNLPAGAGTARS